MYIPSGEWGQYISGMRARDAQMPALEKNAEVVLGGGGAA